MENYVYIVHLHDGPRCADEADDGVFFWMSSRLDVIIQECGRYLKRACPAGRHVEVEYVSQEGFELGVYASENTEEDVVLWFDITRSRV